MTDERRRTPNLDNVVAAIERGAYDKNLALIDAALYARRQELQDAVREQVRQIFGNDFEIVKPTNTIPLPVPHPEPREPAQPAIVSRPRPGSEEPSPDTPAVPDPLGDNDPDIESRSPLIGPWPEGDDQ